MGKLILLLLALLIAVIPFISGCSGNQQKTITVFCGSASKPAIEEAAKAFEEKGASVITISKAESEAFFTVLFKYSTRNWLNICQNAGVEKDAKVIQKYWDEMKWGKWER